MENVINLDNLKKARGSRSRLEVAIELGVTRQQIYNYEKGLSEPPMSVLCKLVKLYGVSLREVLNEKFLSESLN